MEIGETVTLVVEKMKAGKCVLCDSDEHEAPKKDDVKEVAPGNGGWHRKSMSRVFDSDGTRNLIYPNDSFPPPYSSQGHHCIALSALVADANTNSPKDRRLRLNFYLDQVGFFPNRPQNCIGLPARSGWGDFRAFVAALDLDKPLQLHGPGHDESYFCQCDRLLTSLLSALTDPRLCEKKPKDDWKDLLKKRIREAENFAFRKLARNDGAWRLHPLEQVRALALYFMPEAATMTVAGKGGVEETRHGLGRTRKDIVFPDPPLDVGPFS